MVCQANIDGRGTDLRIGGLSIKQPGSVTGLSILNLFVGLGPGTLEVSWSCDTREERGALAQLLGIRSPAQRGHRNLCLLSCRVDKTVLPGEPLLDSSK